MAKYSGLIGRRIDVTYRAGDVVLPVTGTLAADSGKSIFLEESYRQQAGTKTFRWEIPYPCIIELHEMPEMPGPSASVNAPREPELISAPHQGELQLKTRTA